MSQEAAPVEVPAAPTPVASKKVTTKKPASSKSKPSHPKFSEMIAAALKALNDRSGSSRQAICKYVCANYKLEEKFLPNTLLGEMTRNLTSNSILLVTKCS